MPDARQKDDWKLNPYGFSVLDREVVNESTNEKTPGVYNADHSKVLPNASNMCGVKEVDFRYVRCSVLNEGTDYEKRHYKVVAKGKVMFYLNAKCCRCLNMQWTYDPSTKKDYTPPTTDYVEKNEFVYVDGFSFSCLYQNSNEQLGYYNDNLKYD